MPVFLVECDAIVYDNDLNLIIFARTKKEAKEIAMTRLSKEFVKEYKVEELKTKNPYGIGVLHEYGPHAGDPTLGE